MDTHSHSHQGAECIMYNAPHKRGCTRKAVYYKQRQFVRRARVLEDSALTRLTHVAYRVHNVYLYRILSDADRMQSCMLHQIATIRVHDEKSLHV